MIPRTRHETRLLRLLNQFPVVGLIGARQIVKTRFRLRERVDAVELEPACSEGFL